MQVFHVPYQEHLNPFWHYFWLFLTTAFNERGHGGDNRGSDEVIVVDAAKSIDDQCRYVVIDPKDDNRWAKCRERTGL